MGTVRNPIINNSTLNKGAFLMSAEMKKLVLKTTKEAKEKTADYKKNKREKEETPCHSVLLFWFCCRHSLPPAAVRVCGVSSLCRRLSLRSGRYNSRRHSPLAAVGQSPCRKPVIGFLAVPPAPPGRCPLPPPEPGAVCGFSSARWGVLPSLPLQTCKQT